MPLVQISLIRCLKRSRLIITIKFVFRDINSYTKGNPVIEPYRVYKGHSSIVSVEQHKSRYIVDTPLIPFGKLAAHQILRVDPQDVSWHSSNGHLFASVSDDKQLLMYVIFILSSFRGDMIELLVLLDGIPGTPTQPKLLKW